MTKIDRPAEFLKARQDLGLTDTELAQMLGISPARAHQTFSDWKRGVRKIDKSRQRLLVAYLDGYRPTDWPA